MTPARLILSASCQLAKVPVRLPDPGAGLVAVVASGLGPGLYGLLHRELELLDNDISLIQSRMMFIRPFVRPSEAYDLGNH